MQLVLEEAGDRVGQADAVDQQDREDGKEVQQRDQGTGLDTEMLLDHFGDIGAFATGQHKTGQATVRVKRHREGQQREDHQRPEAPQPCVDRQKQGAGANGRPKQSQHPGGVLAIPARKFSGCCCVEALFEAIGLIIHPVGSPHSGHLPLGQDASEKTDRHAPAETGARFSVINQCKQRLS